MQILPFNNTQDNNSLPLNIASPRPLQKGLSLPRARRELAARVFLYLRVMARESPPPGYLNSVNLGDAAPQPVTAIPLKPAARVAIFGVHRRPASLAPFLQRHSALDAKVVEFRIGLAVNAAELVACRIKPLFWQLCCAVIEIFALENAHH